MTSPDDTIALALATKTLPPGITAIMVEAVKHPSLGSGSEVMTGRIFLRDGIPNGTECTTTPIIEDNGSTVRTKNSTYLVKWADDMENGRG